MTGCAGYSCSNRSENGYLLFRFPRDVKRRKEWAHRCARKDWKPTNDSRICEVCTTGMLLSNVNDFYCNFSCITILKVHFPAEMWERKRTDGRRKLKPNAVPSSCNKEVGYYTSHCVYMYLPSLRAFHFTVQFIFTGK